MKSNRIFAIFAAVLLLAGCANNPYKNFYKQNQGTDNYRTNSELILGNGEPIVVRSKNRVPTEENLKLLEDGYVQIGYSSFIGDLQGERGAIEHAKYLNASLVLIFLPNTDGELPSSQYSGGVRVEQSASYWVKSKFNPERFGVNIIKMPDEVAKKLGSNKAVKVLAVSPNSPAFFADVMRDDIIISMDGEPVYDISSFASSIKGKMGKKIEVVIFRDGNKITKNATLGAWK